MSADDDPRSDRSGHDADQLHDVSDDSMRSDTSSERNDDSAFSPIVPEAEGEAAASIALAIEAEGWTEVGIADIEAFLAETLTRTLSGAGLDGETATELSVTLTDDAAIAAINAEWRGKDKPTNVVSFPMIDLAPGDAPGPLLGDLVLAFETCRREAEAEGKSFAAHFRHLVVHGILHCLGHDHEDADEAEVMEQLERRILEGFGIADPYAEADPTAELARVPGPSTGDAPPGGGMAPDAPRR